MWKEGANEMVSVSKFQGILRWKTISRTREFVGLQNGSNVVNPQAAVGMHDVKRQAGTVDMACLHASVSENAVDELVASSLRCSRRLFLA